MKDNPLKSIPSAAINISAIISFDKNIDLISMNNSFEAEKSGPEPTFENTINDIKDNHLKTIASAAMNPSAINLIDGNIEHLSMNSIIEVSKFEPEPKFENTINEIKANNFNSITSIDTNLSAITSNTPSLSSKHLKSDLMTWILLQSPVKLPQLTNHLSSMYHKVNTQLKILKWWVPLRLALYLSCFFVKTF